jgi:hypothetical protein
LSASAVLATLLLVLGIVAASASAQSGVNPSKLTASPLAADSTIEGAKSDVARLAETDPSLLGRTDSTPVNVMIKYDYDSTASYDGGVAGLAATSPNVTGKALEANKGAVDAYENYTSAMSDKIDKAVESAVPGAVVKQTFQTVYGGVAAVVPADQISALLKVDGVVAVQKDTLRQPDYQSVSWIGAPTVWNKAGGSDNAGKGQIVGVLDTGIWPEHPSFADHGLAAPPGTYGCQFGNGLDPALGAPFSCNHKLIGAYAFLQTYLSVNSALPGEFCNNTTKVCSPRDSEGHGTHTSSTAAGNVLDTAKVFGVERGPISGVAPGAYVIMYRVCAEAGCYSSDSVNAVNQAILDGVDVINFSISGGANPYTDAVDLAFLDAFNAGISVNTSAGNSGPGAATAAHGGPWETTVGASTWNGAFTSTLHLKSSDGTTLDKPGVTITGGISSATPVVLAQSIPGEDALCHTPLAAGAATGKIVACQRGDNARVDKGYNVAQGGAAGMILYNPIAQDVETDNHWLPAIHVDGPNTDLTTFISTKPNVTATWTTGIETPAKGNVMATFSSRGPVGDFIKPDITAPGIQVMAGMTPAPVGTVNGPPGQLFQAIAGTSMSSPHSAGASALVRAFHPDWSPAEVKSALMTSASQDVVKEDGVTDFDPFDAGAGGLDVLAAIDPTLVFNETTANFVASATDPLHRIDLNIASIDATTMTGEVSTQRTARNVSNKNQTFDIKITQPAGVTITVGDKNKALKINKGASLTFPITISAPAVANGQYFARINLIPRSGDKSVTIPVAFVRKQGAVTMTHTCAPTTFAADTGVSHCSVSMANLGSLAANVDLTVGNGDDNGKLVYKNASAPATVTGNQVKFSGSLVPALPPQVTSITAGGSPAGYLPLSIFGIAPIAGVGDDTITNFNTPTFWYGGEAYTRLGIVSNGYVVIGGGTAADIVFAPQTFPNPARPNNVVAPFWSDLNPAAAGAIRIGTLTDGVSNWIVIDWAGVRNFSNPTTHSFEVWLKTGATPTTEEVTMAYGTAGAGDPASGVNWGAENRDGTSGKNLAAPPANGSDWKVNLAPPQAGGTSTVTFDVSATRFGTYPSLASLTSNVTPGITQVPVDLTVTP